MKPTLIISLLLLLSQSQAIKIKIPTGSMGAHPPLPPSPHLPGPPIMADPSFHLIRTCDAFTPQISGADLLAFYSQDIYNSLRNIHEQLMIVRHEIQKLAGFALHRIIYKMGGASGASQFVALKIKVAANHQVSVVSYIQSIDYAEICRMMGFPDQRMFSYPCGNLKSQCVQAFIRMASSINMCSGGNQMHVVDDFDYPVDHARKMKRKMKSKMRRRRRRQKRKMMHAMDAMDGFGDMDMSAFEGNGARDISATIHVENGSGEMIHVGSARP